MHARSALSLSLSLARSLFLARSRSFSLALALSRSVFRQYIRNDGRTDGWMDGENGRIGTVPHAGGLFRLRRAKATQPANLFSRAVWYGINEDPLVLCARARFSVYLVENGKGEGDHIRGLDLTVAPLPFHTVVGKVLLGRSSPLSLSLSLSFWVWFVRAAALPLALRRRLSASNVPLEAFIVS